jgi:hypothetical protein
MRDNRAVEFFGILIFIFAITSALLLMFVQTGPAIVREYRCDIVAGTGTFREWQQGALVIDAPLSAIEFNSICMRGRE